MKTIKNTILILLAAASFSCTKKSDDPGPSTQTATLKFSPVVSSTGLNFSSSFTTESGQRYTLSMFRYYVSNIRLVKNDNSEYAVTGKYLLVNPAVSDYDLGSVPVGDYKGLKFTVGLDSVTNHKDPTTYSVTNPLAIQSPAIHWDWNSGYIFLMIEGSCDTTVNNTDVLTYGQYSKGMFFHVGMDPLKREVSLTSSFTVPSTGSKTINVQTDVNKLFVGVNLKTENQSHTMGSMTLATKVANNIPSLFSIIQ